MVTHIQHLEDFAVTAGAKKLREFVADMNNGNYQASIKYDGAPAIVFGTDEGGTFIATKSYFNKTPKKFYTTDEVNAGTPDPQLAFKLLAAFESILECRPKLGNIYQADLLFWESNSIEFQPNIVRYCLGGAGGKEVGMAVHTQLAGDDTFPLASFWAAQTSFYGYEDNIVMPTLQTDVLDITQPVLDVQAGQGVDFFSRITNYHLRNYNRLGLSHAGALVYGYERSIAGKLKRDELKKFEADIDGIGHVAWRMIEHTFDGFSDWKTNIYHELNFHAQHICLATIDKKFYHEGFVIVTPTATVKIVLRDVFSVTNFDPNAARGWSLAK